MTVKQELKRIQLTERCPIPNFSKPVDDIVLGYTRGYAYNAYELCRILNGVPPRKFRPCFYTTKEKPFGTTNMDCKRKLYQCETGRTGVRSRMEKLQRHKKVNSIKIRWFDGRPSGLQTDVFRYYYIDKKSLAKRLEDDLDLYLREKYGTLEELLEYQALYVRERAK